jgi:hypothetical protein
MSRVPKELALRALGYAFGPAWFVSVVVVHAFRQRVLSELM